MKATILFRTRTHQVSSSLPPLCLHNNQEIRGDVRYFIPLSELGIIPQAQAYAIKTQAQHHIFYTARPNNWETLQKRITKSFVIRVG